MKQEKGKKKELFVLNFHFLFAIWNGSASDVFSLRKRQKSPEVRPKKERKKPKLEFLFRLGQPH